ncbi:MAG: TonB-dependent receptor [Bacteroidetes bacterium]|nr:TonB-dependent receptor [Bacteroidota bacterium]
MKVKAKTSLIFIFLLLSFYFSSAQEIKINAINTPLNQVLISIIDSNNVNISFDDNSLSRYTITEQRSFPSIEKALTQLLDSSSLAFELIEDVWVIYPVESRPNETLTVSGRIYDLYSDESLPYSHIIINGWPSISDLSGNYSVVLAGYDSLLHIKVSYLGYYIIDTVLEINHIHNFALTPSSIGLSEIVISDKIVEKTTQIGNQPGLMKLNHKIAHFLPGYGDNSVFNLIRLMPGILASGEQTSELIIWGGYAGHSKVMFDGFTAYGLKNFNDNISSFNPFMAKDIEIHKGGYDASYGGRIGGIVDIIGKNGNTQSPSFTFSINNMTINAMVEIPIAKKGSLILAFRNTYYNLYNPSDMSAIISPNINPDSTTDVDITVVPDYTFRDANIKYSTRINEKDNFYISLHAGDDKFSYIIDELVNNRLYDKKTKDENTQIGGSIFYGHNWEKGNTSKIRFSYSGFNNSYANNSKFTTISGGDIEYKSDDNSTNKLGEYKIENSNSITINQTHTFESGIDLTYNSVKLEEYSFNTKMAYFHSTGGIASIFAQDNISIFKNLNLKAGFRLTHAFYLQKIYFEPRFSATFKLADYWKINAAFGIYNQFIALTTVVDDLGNFKYLWSLSNNDVIPVLNATHYVLGTSYHPHNFTFSVEGYYKNTTGLSRFVNILDSNIKDIFYGKAESYGMDILIKKDLSKHSAWIAYSLSKTIEHFTYFNLEERRRAPQDQRHEIKLAAMLNFDPVYFSTNYVCGSGFPYGNGSQQYNEGSDKKYSRWDASIIYKFLDRKVQGEVGISILNVLNAKNSKYSSFEKIPSNQINDINIYTEALPFTPTLHLKISM